jgi:hypothetical protein
MSRAWEHPLCAYCWKKRHPDQHPTIIKYAKREICCDCGFITMAGIYLRQAPTEMKCKGIHVEMK